jgi:hypothetical protein
MARYLQDVKLQVGSMTGINEVDIMPTTDQTRLGPERPAFRTVIHRVQEACKLLMECDKINELHINVFSNEPLPGSFGQVMEPISQLRGIDNVKFNAYQMGPAITDAWRVKDSYMDYIEEITSWPKGTKTPRYRPVKGESRPEEDDGIFMMRDPTNPSWNEDEYDYMEPWTSEPEHELEAEYGGFDSAFYTGPPDDLIASGSGSVFIPGLHGDRYAQVDWDGFDDGPIHPGAVRDYMNMMAEIMSGR